MTKYLLSFNGSIYERQANALRDRIAVIFEQKDYESLTVLFSSERGNTMNGLALYNFFRSSPKPIHLHAVGNVGGVAVPVFCGATKRTCATIARFSFHAFDWGFDEGRQTLDRITEAQQTLTSDVELSKEMVARHTKFPAEQLATLYHPNHPTPTIFNSDQAKHHGLVDEVLDINASGADMPGYALWTVNQPSP
jgi:ATP-dependent protease ClpP protease subunit